ncbi:C40 family peptidase [Kitasatospora cineracea]|uniref:Cell wall-associated NlpC family hydrolase n=1 Tax=Kitasatospora cineracea TaxID=88074 RepID=A0A8G1UFJ5_9ACTN|nr:NlpC/P60 family protein [Kitasatospora cineracea]ROR43002.1 cell wall-associated NlpC family hydrolase [Kitasatospora cineracea]
MGTRRKPNPPSRTRLTLLATAAAGSALLSGAPGAQAEPKPSVESVKAQVEDLNEQAEVSIEKFNGIEERRAKLQQQVTQIQDQVAAGQGTLNELSSGLGALAAEQYRSGSLDPTVQLMLSGNPDDYLQRASAQEQLADSQAGLLKQVQEQQRRLDQQRSEATAALAELDSMVRQSAQEKQLVQGKLAEAQRLLNSLSAADRVRVNAQDAGNRASRDAARTPVVSGPVSGRAAAAIQFATAQLGKPYIWGGTGPAGYDCSGLTLKAWAAAGVSLPRVSQSQWNAGTRIAKADLQPGDLVFFYSDLHHVGLYIGGGNMIHAPRTGKNVEVQSISVMPYVGAVRPG